MLCRSVAILTVIHLIFGHHFANVIIVVTPFTGSHSIFFWPFPLWATKNAELFLDHSGTYCQMWQNLLGETFLVVKYSQFFGDTHTHILCGDDIGKLLSWPNRASTGTANIAMEYVSICICLRSRSHGHFDERWKSHLIRAMFLAQIWSKLLSLSLTSN